MLSGIEWCTDEINSPKVSWHTQVSDNEDKVKPQPAQKQWSVVKTRWWGPLLKVCVRYRGYRGEPSKGEYIFRRHWSRLTLSHLRLVLSCSDSTHSIGPDFWSHLLVPLSHGSTQLCGSSQLHSIISSHPLPTLLKPEPLFLTNSVWMSPEVQWSVDGGLSAF